MALREIIRPDNPVLRKKAHKVTDFKDPKLKELIDDMVETLADSGGVGLAAPQVAVSQRLIIVRLPDDEESKEEYGEDAGKLYVLANPEITRASEEMVEGVEGCLSIPGYWGTVDRHVAISIKGQDQHGKEVRLKVKDWIARVFQHEIDHLEGVLYIDKATKVWSEEEAEENPPRRRRRKTTSTDSNEPAPESSPSEEA